MRRVSRVLFLLITILYFTGCEKKEISDKLQDVHWDRDMCSRCKMVTSDRHHTVQVINIHDGKSYMFDDIGCTILWFNENNISWRTSAKIWITDGDSGEWIDARDAFYDGENLTPMAYGFMAHKSKSDIKESKEIFSYTDIIQKVIDIEKKNNSGRYRGE